MIITRGDTKKYKFQRRDYQGQVIMEPPIEIYFTVKKLPECSMAFQKKLGDGITFDEQTGYYTIQIDPEDTENLCFGDYGFDIEVDSQDDVIKTICVGKLKIGVEYTTRKDK